VRPLSSSLVCLAKRITSITQCEENGVNVGRIFEVDPLGSLGSNNSNSSSSSANLDATYTYGYETCMGEGGGNFESAAFDGRQLDPSRCPTDVDYCQVDFFVTNDDAYGAVRKYTPLPTVVQTAYQEGSFTSILSLPVSVVEVQAKHDGNGSNGNANVTVTGYEGCASKRQGEIQFLKITSVDKDDNDVGTFEWTTDQAKGETSAKRYFPNTEGIDAKDGMLYLVSKTKAELFILDLTAGTWERSSTIWGAFNHQPDQLKFITGDTSSSTSGDGGHVYFTEDGGTRCGVHARRARDGYYMTILESDESSVYNDETSGLAFSPDKRRMYFAFQGAGDLWEVYREDGLPFDGDTIIDIKYHSKNK
jgi:hypothetical protein